MLRSSTGLIKTLKIMCVSITSPPEGTGRTGQLQQRDIRLDPSLRRYLRGQISELESLWISMITYP